MIHGAATIATRVTTESTTSTNVRKRAPAIRPSSGPCRLAQSTSSGTKTLVKIPPRISSYTMFGVVFAMT
jgi:hypothetical protein